MALSNPRKSLLKFLHKRGGQVRGKSLTTPQRRLASQMETDGLVHRENTTFRSDSWDRAILRITAAGYDVLSLHSRRSFRPRPALTGSGMISIDDTNSGAFRGGPRARL